MIAIYNRLTGSNALLPPALGFVFDRESLPEDAQADLKKRSNEAIHFLGRRMFENYLLDSRALFAVLQGELAAIPEAPRLTVEAVTTWLSDARTAAKYVPKDALPALKAGRSWEQEVDGAGLMQSLFAELSGGLLQYGKVQHGQATTLALLDIAPNAFDEIVALFRKILPA